MKLTSLCQHLHISIEHVQWVFEILLKLNICPISHHIINFVYQNLMYIEGCHSIKQKDMKLNTLCQHSQTPIEHVQLVFEILMKPKKFALSLTIH